MALDIMQFLARFVEEAKEHIESANKGLLSLEKNPGDSEVLNAIFRAAHSIKGSARMMKFTSIGEVAHKLEEVLDALRGKRISFSRQLSDLLFMGIDIISAMVDEAESGTGGAMDVQAICAALEKAAKGELGDVPKAADVNREGSPQPAAESPPETEEHHSVSRLLSAAEHLQGGDKEQLRGRSYETIRVDSNKLDSLIKLVGEMTSSQSRLKEKLAEIRVIEKLASRWAQLPGSPQNGGSSNDEDASELPRSFHLGLKQLASEITDEANVQELLLHDLQGSSLSMRMVPLSTLFDSFHRIVRDISNALLKKVHFVVEGGETELDKKLVEKIGDPLIHMIRNAIDHGIEKPEDRLRAGKLETGTVRLAARYEGDTVLIELSDDGGGISLENITRKALQKNLFTREQLDRLASSEVVNLIFHPGFSTSEIITDVSGRGVGMDVVKKNIVEGLKGSIQTESVEGKGTTFAVRLQLTLAIMRALFVSVANLTFAIPCSSVKEILRVRENGIIDVVNRKAIILHEQLIPAVDLGRVLGVVREPDENDMGPLCLVCSTGREKMGFLVEEILDEKDVVIKPLPAHMQNTRFVSGVTVSGRNEIISVLSVPSITEAAKEVKAEIRRKSPLRKKIRAASVLVVDDSANTREIEKSVLEAYGYNVTLAGDGVEALEKAGRTQYDAIVADIEMPRMDGFSFTEALRRNESYRDTPIILVTSRDRDEDKRRGIKVGANAYIVKGAFDQSSLVETIRNLIG